MGTQTIFKKLTKRDYTGSPSDKYAQDLTTFHMQSCLQNRETDFFNLLAKAVNESKKIVLDPMFVKEMGDTLYSDIPFDRLILA